MAILVHARKTGEHTDFRLYDSTDRRYLTPPDSLVGAFDALTALLMETEIAPTHEAQLMLQAMVGRAAEDGTSSRRMERERTLDSDWVNDTHGSWKFERPADRFGRSEMMKLHIRVGLLESFRDLAETSWIRQLESDAPRCARLILQHNEIVQRLARERFTWRRLPKDGRDVDGEHPPLGYRGVKELQVILGALRKAWRGNVFIDELTDDGPRSDIVRVRFCVL